MQSFDIAQLIYFVILLVAVLGWFLSQNRQNLNQTVQSLAIWAFIFLGAIAGYGLWEDVRGELVPSNAVISDGQSLIVPRSYDGHYYLTLDVSGTPVTFLVDTGATQMVLTLRDAERIGIEPETLVFLGRAQTANGEVRTAAVRLDSVAVGGFSDQNVRAWVNEGDLNSSLLGMGYLQLWSSVEIRQNELVLTR
ncbi:TIGR02281 family clan AA aspartic protease [Epibacterium sp. SM1969]|uniref:TIGR02281 family clan AA aspartic protease n=1 Tax=Tritonibacter aquimaris TaxID=2663379 RepID=A0A844AQJ3_9RHOB|nr:TIGR02281 family clan AA aspartic protease [Tritonibacter aquimaris]MQY41258.1 TIGR02281 family clan AA aspartic protease [Tritonibacter aquimaris]